MESYEVLRRPIVTEKSTMQAEQRVYTFEVDGRANKLQVKEAVEKAFGVKVVSVNIINVPGKPRRWGRHVSHTPSWKKAIVKLAEGQRIEFFEGV
ncbi:MAG: 50S ribosomal protein L23 [Anaerolineae bacterium]|jgi:large subunit ribosomal protein L23|nr:50S ribosomal protein L23 [Anaerolineae bacterium]